jgi:hypothetical protein
MSIRSFGGYFEKKTRLFCAGATSCKATIFEVIGFRTMTNSAKITVAAVKEPLELWYTVKS